MIRILFLTCLAVIALLIGCRKHGQVSIKRSNAVLSFKTGDEHKSLKVAIFNHHSYFTIYNKVLGGIRIYEPGLPDKALVSIPDSGLGIFRSFLVYNSDSIFLKYQYGIILKNLRDSVLSIYPYGGLIKANGERLVISDFDFYEPLMYHSAAQSLVFRIYPYDINYFDLGFYQHPVFTSFSLKDKRYKCLKVYYPRGYHSSSYGGANEVYYALKGDNILISFQASDNLYRYNLIEDRMLSSEGCIRDTFTKFNIRDKKDMSRVLEHLTLNNLSQKILADSSGKIIVKFSWLKKDIINKDGTFNSLKDKDLLLEVFNSDWKFLASYNLGNTLNWFDAFFWKGYLYIGKKKILDHKYTYEKIKIDIIY